MDEPRKHNEGGMEWAEHGLSYTCSVDNGSCNWFLICISNGLQLVITGQLAQWPGGKEECSPGSNPG